ncbi:Cdc20 [Capsaspora owczarzaki ATCC 30864]|uniref:Cdc20 n=1 Tax=Capsaspora owczarzaki (strain ATCC 30864) TaxID=595528 RepID=A0A0D2WV11_CAPO3|nr:Cdc20 [Capsaspora owczarzaki ATCC 30864]KJE96555.1 Cdc20 [Capsaspora owczarzaki ATCC 30864]|eukprot:XP_004344482.1 Cdc20 [Capsaspora owczarzaki ATCC 30864]
MNFLADSSFLATSAPQTPASASLNVSAMSMGSRGSSRTSTGRRPSSGADRFIANRNSMDLELSNFHLLRDSPFTASSVEGAASVEASPVATAAAAESSPSRKRSRAEMSQLLFSEAAESSILALKQKVVSLPLTTVDANATSARTVTGKTKQTMRVVPQVPEKTLDAPGMHDDFFMNVLDWNSNNLLAVGLSNSVYVWNASSGSICRLLELKDDAHVTSLKWSEADNYLAVGSSDSSVAIYDVNREKQIRNMVGHQGSVPALSWRSHILTSGSTSGAIHNHDVRLPNHHVGTYSAHTGAVCNVSWSPDGTQLASGGNDNSVFVWDGVTSLSSSTPAHSLEGHGAAVKALAWSPMQANLLATGAGLADRHIRFWNTANGALMNVIDTGAQISSLMWSKNHKEIVASHGLPSNRLTIWKYPTLQMVAELNGHQGRVLHMAMSPDGETVVSASSDETLRFWKCFASAPAAKKSNQSTGVLSKCAGQLNPSSLAAAIATSVGIKDRIR